jgi:hypothetical protein
MGRSVEIYLGPDYRTGTEFGYRACGEIPLERAENMDQSSGIGYLAYFFIKNLKFLQTNLKSWCTLLR